MHLQPWTLHLPRGVVLQAQTPLHFDFVPTTESLVPIQEHECPLCFEHLGREAVASHLRNIYQIDKPNSFPFRPNLDIFPGRLSCMHCKANFTTAFALKNHFDRGTCPILLLNWIRDAHYGPKIETDHSPSTQQDLPPLPTQGIHPTWTCGLLLGTDKHPTMALRHHVHVNIDQCLQFRPENRLLWYTFIMRWIIPFHDLPQVALHLGIAPYIVRWIVEPLPLHWAWSSDSPNSWWDPRTIDLDTDPLDQINWFCTAILELEHALARDFILTPGGFDHGRQYVDGRHVICRPLGYLSGPSQAPANRGGIIAGQSSWERQIEKPIRLLNHLFEARRGFRAPDDAGQINLAPRRYAQSNGLGPQFPSVFTGRQRLDPTGNDPGNQGMASSETNHWSHMLPPSGQFPQSGRGDDPTADEIEIRQPGRSPGPSIAWNYLSWDSAAKCLRPTKQQPLQHDRIQEITIQLSQLASQGDLIQHFSALKPMNRDQVPEDSQCDDPVAPRSQPLQRRIDAALRDPQPPERKRDLSIDPSSIEANRPAKISTCYSNRPPCATLIHQLLRVKLPNSSNACYINAALLGQI